MATGFWSWAPNATPSFVNKATLKSVLGVVEGDTPAANGATPVAVAQTAVTALSKIDLTLKTAAGTVSAAFVVSKTPGTGFSFATGASNTSTYHYTISEP